MFNYKLTVHHNLFYHTGEFPFKMRVAVKFAYDGRGFHGYARQPQIETIEGRIVESLRKYGFIEDTDKSQFRSASRTDKGVSALCNVIAFNTDSSKKNILQMMSSEFTTIVTYGIKNVPPDFNPRYAKLRCYRYHLNRNSIDFERAISVADAFTGERDFSNFARIELFKNPVRSIVNILYTKNRNFLNIDFYAQTFLWHQIRRIISAIINVEKGKIEKKDILKALERPKKKVDFGLAPAEPLILKDIIYDFDFEYDEKLFGKLNKLEDSILKSLDVTLIKPPKS